MRAAEVATFAFKRVGIHDVNQPGLKEQPQTPVIELCQTEAALYTKKVL